VDLRHLHGLLPGVGGYNGLAAPPPPPPPPTDNRREPNRREPTPPLHAAAAGHTPPDDTRSTVSRDATAVESSTANEPAKIHHQEKGMSAGIVQLDTRTPAVELNHSPRRQAPQGYLGFLGVHCYCQL
jgi:hypothetical protein